MYVIYYFLNLGTEVQIFIRARIQIDDGRLENEKSRLDLIDYTQFAASPPLLRFIYFSTRLLDSKPQRYR